MTRGIINSVNGLVGIAVVLFALYPVRGVPFNQIVLGLAFILLYVGFLAYTTTPSKGGVAIKTKDGYRDLGPGGLIRGVFFFLDTVPYDTAPRLLTWTIRLPSRGGQQLAATAHVSWRPDTKEINAFLEDSQIESRLRVKAENAIQSWAKLHWVNEIYHGQPGFPELKGITIESVELNDIKDAPEYDGIKGKMPVDHMEGIERIIRNAESFEALREVKERLKVNAKTQAEQDFIEISCADREAKMRSEAIK